MTFATEASASNSSHRHSSTASAPSSSPLRGRATINQKGLVLSSPPQIHSPSISVRRRSRGELDLDAEALAHVIQATVLATLAQQQQQQQQQQGERGYEFGSSSPTRVPSKSKGTVFPITRRMEALESQLQQQAVTISSLGARLVDAEERERRLEAQVCMRALSSAANLRICTLKSAAHLPFPCPLQLLSLLQAVAENERSTLQQLQRLINAVGRSRGTAAASAAASAAGPETGVEEWGCLPPQPLACAPGTASRHLSSVASAAPAPPLPQPKGHVP